jgi:hypothetical protein
MTASVGRPERCSDALRHIRCTHASAVVTACSDRMQQPLAELLTPLILCVSASGALKLS